MVTPFNVVWIKSLKLGEESLKLGEDMSKCQLGSQVLTDW